MATPHSQTIKKSTSPPRPGGPPSTAPPGRDRSRSPSPDEPLKVTIDQLIKEGLPPLVVSKEGKRTKKASTGGVYDYHGEFKSWTTFDDDVLKLISQTPPNNTEPILYRPSSDPLARIEIENFVCAEEKGVEGRFNQQGIHIVQIAALLAKLPVMAGDFHGTNEAANITTKKPDFACMAKDAQQGVRFVGECKADWSGAIKDDYDATHFPKDPDERIPRSSPLKKWLLQEAAYMKKLKLKYGFMSTYDHTIFFHYEMTDLKSDETVQDCVSVSKPIPHKRAYDERRGRVSVRQGLWFLMLNASNDWEMGQGIAIPREPLPTRSQKDKNPQGPPPGGNGDPKPKKPTTGGGDSSGLSQKMGGLNITDTTQKKPTAAPTTSKKTADPTILKKNADPKPPKPKKPVDPTKK